MAESENVAVARAVVDAFNHLDVDAVAAQADPDMELHEWPTGPDPRTYRGPEGIRQALDTWFESWEWMKIEIVDLEEVGEQVLVTLHQRAQGRGSKVEVEITSYNVYTFDDGKLIRMQLFTEHQPALEAAGLTQTKEATQ